MAERSYSVTARVDPTIVWERWTNVELWPADDPDLEKAVLNGPLAKGALGWVKRRNRRKATFRITEVDRSNMVFTIEGRRPWATLTLEHTLTRPEPAAGGGPDDAGVGGVDPDARVLTHRLTITGLMARLWDRVLGRAIGDGLPTVAQNIVRAASR